MMRSLVRSVVISWIAIDMVFVMGGDRPGETYHTIQLGRFKKEIVSAVLQSSTCGYPGEPAGGVLFGWEGNIILEGTEVRYECGEGRVMIGGRIRKCEKNGTWSDSLPLCSKIYTLYQIMKILMCAGTVSR